MKLGEPAKLASGDRVCLLEYQGHIEMRVTELNHDHSYLRMNGAEAIALAVALVQATEGKDSGDAFRNEDGHIEASSGYFTTPEAAIEYALDVIRAAKDPAR